MAEQAVCRGRRPRKLRPIRIERDVAYVPLTRGYVAMIDAADAPEIGRHNWFTMLTTSGHVYAARGAPAGQRPRHILMHRTLCEVAPDQDVDHRDGDGLNNRRSNLRPCSHELNLANVGPTRRNKLGVRGVSQKGNRFQAKIEVRGHQFKLGSYRTIEEAAAAYRGAAKVLYGEFARDA